jgi:hypothetical protein
MTTTNTDQKLVDDIKALLRTNGFTDLTLVKSSDSVNISGVKGGSGAVFHLVSQRPNKANGRQTAGGLEIERASDVAVVPTVPEIRAQMTRDPAAAAKLLGISPEMLAHVMASEKAA